MGGKEKERYRRHTFKNASYHQTWNIKNKMKVNELGSWIFQLVSTYVFILHTVIYVCVMTALFIIITYWNQVTQSKANPLLISFNTGFIFNAVFNDDTNTLNEKRITMSIKYCTF
jgi:hypothetical protein